MGGVGCGAAIFQINLFPSLPSFFRFLGQVISKCTTTVVAVIQVYLKLLQAVPQALLKTDVGLIVE